MLRRFALIPFILALAFFAAPGCGGKDKEVTFNPIPKDAPKASTGGAPPPKGGGAQPPSPAPKGSAVD